MKARIKKSNSIYNNCYNSMFHLACFILIVFSLISCESSDKKVVEANSPIIVNCVLNIYCPEDSIREYYVHTLIGKYITNRIRVASDTGIYFFKQKPEDVSFYYDFEFIENNHINFSDNHQEYGCGWNQQKIENAFWVYRSEDVFRIWFDYESAGMYKSFFMGDFQLIPDSIGGFKLHLLETVRSYGINPFSVYPSIISYNIIEKDSTIFGLTAAKTDSNKVGFLDSNNEWSFPPVFHRSALALSDSLALWVELDTIKQADDDYMRNDAVGIWRLFDRKGFMLLDEAFIEPAPFINGFTVCESANNRSQYIINNKGEILFQSDTLTILNQFEKGMFYCSLDAYERSRWGVIKNNKILINPEYDDIYFYQNKFLLLKDSIFSVRDVNGEILTNGIKTNFDFTNATIFELLNLDQYISEEISKREYWKIKRMGSFEIILRSNLNVDLIKKHSNETLKSFYHNTAIYLTLIEPASNHIFFSKFHLQESDFYDFYNCIISNQVFPYKYCGGGSPTIEIRDNEVNIKYLTNNYISFANLIGEGNRFLMQFEEKCFNYISANNQMKAFMLNDIINLNKAKEFQEKIVIPIEIIQSHKDKKLYHSIDINDVNNDFYLTKDTIYFQFANIEEYEFEKPYFGLPLSNFTGLFKENIITNTLRQDGIQIVF